MGNIANVEVLGHYSWLLLAWALSGTQPVTCTEDKESNASPGSWQGKAAVRGWRYRGGESERGDVAAV